MIVSYCAYGSYVHILVQLRCVLLAVRIRAHKQFARLVRWQATANQLPKVRYGY